MKNLFLLICLLSWSCSFGEGLLKGRLIDAVNKEPVEYALLYIDGTTKSTTTSSEGFFSFAVPNLPAQIEVSHLNYQPKSLFVESIIEDVVTINMVPRENILNDVLILDKRAKQVYLAKFKEEFLGADFWGKHAKLINEDCLIFSGEKSDLHVSATKPLLVEMPKLGYFVRVELIDFATKNDTFNTSSTKILAKCHFEDISNQKKNIAKSRNKAYFNSRHHFLRSLYQNNLLENGFHVFKYVRDSNKVINQVPVNLVDSVKQAEDWIEIINQKDQKYQIHYFSKNGRPLNLNNDEPKFPYEASSVQFQSDDIKITKDGTSPSSGIIFSGYMGYKRAGAALPSDFKQVLNKEKEVSK